MFSEVVFVDLLLVLPKNSANIVIVISYSWSIHYIWGQKDLSYSIPINLSK